MFAIKITEENLPKIYEEFTQGPNFRAAIDTYLRLKADWYLVSGYIGQFTPIGYAVLPQYILARDYQCDLDVLGTHWDQIVRKEQQ